MRLNRCFAVGLIAAITLLLAACAPLPPLVPGTGTAPTVATPPTVEAPTGTAPTSEPAATTAPATATPAGGLTPPSAEVCNGMAQSLMQAVGTGVEVVQTANVEMTDPATGASGMACRAQAEGTGKDFTSPQDAMNKTAAVLKSGGWQEDMRMAAGGATGTGMGFRSGDLVCMAIAQWQPGPAVTCPADQPISACNVPPEQQMYTVTLDCANESAPSSTPGAAGMPNPASQNCVAQGGKLQIETRADGGQFGVCYFEDNRQCEEWALMRGDCPVGGVKVTGYVTEAARYCAITGGTYTVTGNSGATDEQGTCSFKGQQCDAWDLYNGKCQFGQ